MKRNERGVSLIALVITIIVIIILAAIAFSSSTRTITEANKSNIINNISEVSSAFHTESVTVKGKVAAKGNAKTNEQVYNYVAKGGKEDDDFLVRVDIPAYTVIKGNADIGIKLPKMKLESGTGKLIDVKYAATKEGKIFIWPPYEDEGKFYITDKDTVETNMTTNIKVGNESLTIVIDQNDGSLLDADGTTGGSGTENEGTGGDTEDITVGSLVKNNKIKVGDYVIYTPVTANYRPDDTKTGDSQNKELETKENVEWRVLSINATAGTIKVTTVGVANTGIYLSGDIGYVKGPGELHTICEKLYSNTSKGITARSMTLEDLNEACGYTPSPSTTKYAYYKSSDYVSGTTDGYENQKHGTSYENGYTEPRFYTYDENGETKTVEIETDYKVPTATSPVKVTRTNYTYDLRDINATVGGILGYSSYWLASQCAGTGSSSATFYIREVYRGEVSICDLVYSYGTKRSFYSGLRPLLDLNSNIKIEQQSEGVWEIK